MNLKDIRTAVFSQADWAPTQSEDAVTRANDFINRAYFQLAQEAPFLFFENRTSFATIADETSAADSEVGGVTITDTLHVLNTDPWVLRRDINSATGPVAVTGYTAWDITGRWRGRTIRLEDSTGRVHHHKIRDVWINLVAGYEQITLLRPWHNLTDTGIKWRIYTEDYYLPDDVIEVNSIRLSESNQNWPLDIIGQLEAEKLSLADEPGQTAAGLPRVAFRRGHKQIDSPTLAPTLTLGVAGLPAQQLRLQRRIPKLPLGPFISTPQMSLICRGLGDNLREGPRMSGITALAGESGSTVAAIP
jgi:hypothetical protein